MTQTLIRRHVAATHPRGPNPVSTRAQTRARRATVPHRLSTRDTARRDHNLARTGRSTHARCGTSTALARDGTTGGTGTRLTWTLASAGAPRGLPLRPLGATWLRSETSSSRPFDPRTGPALRPQPAEGVSAQPPSSGQSARCQFLPQRPARCGSGKLRSLTPIGGPAEGGGHCSGREPAHSRISNFVWRPQISRLLGLCGWSLLRHEREHQLRPDRTSPGAIVPIVVGRASRRARRRLCFAAVAGRRSLERSRESGARGRRPRAVPSLVHSPDASVSRGSARRMLPPRRRSQARRYRAIAP